MSTSRFAVVAERLQVALESDVPDIGAVDAEAEADEWQRLTDAVVVRQEERMQQKASAAIPTFYRRGTATVEAFPDGTKPGGEDDDDDEQRSPSRSPNSDGGEPSDEKNPYIGAEGARMLSGRALRFLWKGAARHVEVERYLELVDAWETIQPSLMWDALRDAKKEEYEQAVSLEKAEGQDAVSRNLPAGAMSTTHVSYPTYLQAVRKFQQRIIDENPGTGARLCELVSGVSGPDLDTALSPTAHGNDTPDDQLSLPPEAYFVPKLDATLFLACRREPNGTVEFSSIYSNLMVQLALFKTAVELIMRDVDNDGSLTEAELEEYAALICRQVPALRDVVPDDLVPFYSCMVARRLSWAVEGAANRQYDSVLRYAAPSGTSVTATPVARGACGANLVRINRLIEHEELRFWVQAQLALDEGKDGWYSATNFMNLYDKFCNLDRRASGMLERGDFEQYKKGVPAVMQDGLPPGTCPISEIFIDRFFEVTSTFSGELDFKCFVDFTLNIEFLPAKCHNPGLFFDCFDLDGDGVIVPTDLQAFFRETRDKLVAAGLQDTVPVELFVRELFDALEPAESLRCTRAEFLRSPSAGIVAGATIDPLTFFAYDSRDSDVSGKQQHLYRYEQPLRR